MKKLLLVNTKYREYGGEDSNILEEKHFLSKYYDVKYLEYDNSSKIGLSDLKSFITNNNRKSNKALLKVFNSFKPDIVYIHNTWFKANLGLFKVLERLKKRAYFNKNRSILYRQWIHRSNGRHNCYHRTYMADMA